MEEPSLFLTVIINKIFGKVVLALMGCWESTLPTLTSLFHNTLSSFLWSQPLWPYSCAFWPER